MQAEDEKKKKKEEKEESAVESEDEGAEVAAVDDKSAKIIIRKKQDGALKFKKGDLAFHHSFGLVQILDITKGDDGSIVEISAKSFALEKQTVTLLGEDIAVLSQNITISMKIHLANKTSITSDVQFQLKKGATLANILQGLNDILGSSCSAFIGGKPVDEKVKIQKILKTTEFKMVLYAKGGAGDTLKPDGVRWWGRFLVHQ